MDLDQTLATATQKLMGAVEKYGPASVDFAKEVGRIAAAQEIAYGIAFAIVSFGVWHFIVRPLISKMLADMNGSRDITDSDEIIVIFGVGGGTMAMVACGIASATKLLDVFAWIGLAHPEIYMAAKLLKL